MLRRVPALTEEVPRKDHRRCPHRPTQDAVEDERAPVHAARARHQRFENARDREEAASEDGLAAVAREEPFDPLQALRRELHVAPPLQDERSSRLVAHPVADLVADDGPEDPEDYGTPEAEVALLDKHAGGQDYGRARDGDSHGSQHHAEEDDQVPVVLDQGVEFVHVVRSIRTATAFEGLSKRPHHSVGSPAPARNRTPVRLRGRKRTPSDTRRSCRRYSAAGASSTRSTSGAWPDRTVPPCGCCPDRSRSLIRSACQAYARVPRHRHLR